MLCRGIFARIVKNWIRWAEARHATPNKNHLIFAWGWNDVGFMCTCIEYVAIKSYFALVNLLVNNIYAITIFSAYHSAVGPKLSPARWHSIELIYWIQCIALVWRTVHHLMGSKIQLSSLNGPAIRRRKSPFEIGTNTTEWATMSWIEVDSVKIITKL